MWRGSSTDHRDCETELARPSVDVDERARPVEVYILGRLIFATG